MPRQALVDERVVRVEEVEDAAVLADDVLDELVAKLSKNGDKFSDLVLGIVESDPFQKRRGKRSE